MTLLSQNLVANPPLMVNKQKLKFNLSLYERLGPAGVINYTQFVSLILNLVETLL